MNIVFKVLFEGSERSIPWSRICKVAGVAMHMPNTYELLDVKRNLSESFKIDLDDVTVEMNGSPIL